MARTSISVERFGIARLAVFVAVIAATMGIGLVPAMAAETTSATAGEEHCVYSAVDRALDGELTLKEDACFGTYSAALTFATGLNVPADVPGSAMEYEGFQQTMGSTSTLAQHFDGYAGTGSSIIIRGSTCSAYWNTSSSWDNRISSTYNGCYRTRHYDDPYLSGTNIAFFGALMLFNMSSWMNNRTESVRYYSW